MVVCMRYERLWVFASPVTNDPYPRDSFGEAKGFDLDVSLGIPPSHESSDVGTGQALVATFCMIVSAGLSRKLRLQLRHREPSDHHQ